MRSLWNIFLAIVFCLTSTAQAAHTQARLILSAATARPGETIFAGVHLRMDAEWHTYWKNSGASGIPTAIEWTFPAGITNGDIQWPIPEKLPPDDLTTYIYHHEVVLLVPLRLASNLTPGSHTLKAKVSWLECKEQCLPGDADLEATVRIGNETVVSPDAELIQAWQRKLPDSGKVLSIHAEWENAQSGKLRPVILEWSFRTNAGAADFLPYASDNFEVQGATERLPAGAGKIRLRKLVKSFEGNWPQEISGVLIQKAADHETGYEVTIPIAQAG
ncbi:MAG: hypothetical protein H7Y43_18200, partial [Akkermansiaceae bacterium]|nr:hypothetical protein [Verrucomicrobiales bacterium]